MSSEGLVLSTERLTLRRMVEADLPDLAAILQDARTMVAYEGPFSDAEVRAWLERMREREADAPVAFKRRAVNAALRKLIKELKCNSASK